MGYKFLFILCIVCAILVASWLTIPKKNYPIRQKKTEDSRNNERSEKFNSRFICPLIKGEINIDGKLQEAAWRKAPVRYLTRIYQTSPIFPVTVRCFWDQTALYVGFNSEDLDVISNLKDRDSKVWTDGDCFEIFIEPSSGTLSKIELQFNPNDALLDIGYKTENKDDPITWNWKGAQWKAEIDGSLNDSKLDRKWSLEVCLPWESLLGENVISPPQLNSS